MPLIGLISPDHKERASDAPGRYPKWLSLADVLAEANAASPKWSPWPYELIAALVGEHQERAGRLSVTALTGGCMRGNMVERKEDYIGSLDGSYASLRGTMIHKVLEAAARPGSLAEWRFYGDVDGQEISGSPDLITYDSLWDYKSTSEAPKFDYMYNGHKLQLQFNRFLFNNATKWDPPNCFNGKALVAGADPNMAIPMDPFHTKLQHLVIVYLAEKGPKVLETVKTIERTRRDGGKWKAKVPDVWTDEQVLDELRPRMEAWKMAWDSYPDWPDGLEKYAGWEGPPEFRCWGPPLCYLPACVAKRLPNGLVWTSK